MCGLVRSNFSLAIEKYPPQFFKLTVPNGAHNWNRTSDLFLTKEVLYRLSYVGFEHQTDSLTPRLPVLFGIAALQLGAGDGNRTHTISLEG